MMNCDVIRDLLPLYADGAVSEKTKALINDHLQTCPECRHFYSGINHGVHSFEYPEKPGNYHYSEVARKIKATRLAELAAVGIVITAAMIAIADSMTSRPDKN